MKKFILFLFLAIAMATTAMAQFSFSNEKVYTLTTTRGWLIYNPDNEAFVASTASYTDFAVSEGNANCQWAIHKSKNGRYYLYNIGAGKFIGKNSNEGGRFPWVATPTNSIQIVSDTTNSAYEYVFSTDNYGAINHFSHTTAPGVANWKGNATTGGLRSLDDPGSAHRVNEVGDIDSATLANIARLVDQFEENCVEITYELTYEDNVRFTQTTEAIIGEEYPEIIVTLPFGITAQKPAGVIAANSEMTIKIPLVASGEFPFEYAASYEEITDWYNLVIQTTERVYISYNPSGYLAASATAVDTARAKSYIWGFVGNPIDGFSIVNRLAGKNMVLTSKVPESDNVLPYMASKSHITTQPLTWDVKKSQYGENGFFIAYSGTDICLNRQNQKICYWINGADSGSTFYAEKCNIEDTLTPDEETITEGEVIDLGLSVKWRAYNVDASSPEEFGSYYLWDGTDIAQTHLGQNWYMPTMEEGLELIEQCTWEWMSYNGTLGFKVTGPNGNSIFMPAGGWIHASTGQLVYFEEEGNYWTITGNGGGYAYDIEFTPGRGAYLDPGGYIYGWQVVRPVYHARARSLDEFQENKCYTITCERGAWTVAEERFVTTNDAAEEISETNLNQHFAVLSADGVDYYLYSIAAKKFVKKDGTLVAGIADPIVLNSATEQGAGRVQIQFKSTDIYVNINDNHSAALNNWYKIDAGNSVLFTEVGDFDATEALAMLKKEVGTGIDSVPAEKQSAIYDLQGRRVTKLQKGVIYIKNNKKLIAR